MNSTQKNSSSKWIVGLLASILTLAGYYMFSESMDRKCRDRALMQSVESIYVIADAKWSIGGCQYLAKLENVNSSYQWWSHDIVEHGANY